MPSCANARVIAFGSAVSDFWTPAGFMAIGLKTEAGANLVMADIQKDLVEQAAHGLSGTNKRVLPRRIASAVAIPSPMPEAAPVTIAVLPEMSFICEVPSAFGDGLQFQKPSRRVRRKRV